MTFYILPDQVKQMQDRLARMFKHLTNVPNVTFSDVHKVKQTVTYDMGEDGYDRECYWIDAIRVDIDEIRVNEWVLIASIYYADQIVTMVSNEYFKVMPKQYGLNYTKCDACGSTREARKEMHVIYNTNTGKWMQVGSSCVNKMIVGGKYLSTFALDLCKYVKFILGGCDEMDWGGGWMPKADKYRCKAIRVEDAISLAYDYRKINKGDYAQPVYGRYGKEEDGTIDKMIAFSQGYKGKASAAVLKGVKAHVDSLADAGYNAKIKQMYIDEWVNLYNLHLAFFAVKGWQESQIAGVFDAYIADNKIEVGTKIALSVELVGLKRQQSMYTGDWEYVATFNDENGITFRKTFSSKDVMEAYKTSETQYKFTAAVKWINTERKYIGLGGRLSKFKK